MGVRTTAFVDGLNLYHGIRDEKLLKFRWLDIEGMVESLAADAGARLGSPLEVIRVVYCTSLVRDRQAARRQDIYLQALEQHCAHIEILRGSYEEKSRQCTDCGASVGFQKEKQTDVNLAVEMVKDAAKPVGQRAEVQILVTGDTDLLPRSSCRPILRGGRRDGLASRPWPHARVLHGHSVWISPGESPPPTRPPPPRSCSTSNK